MSQGCWLAIESSSPRASIALSRAGELVYSSEIEAGGRPSEILLAPLQLALDHLSGEPLDLVLVGTGPGSYNGARVGIAAGQGVGLIHRCPTVGVCSLEALSSIREGGRCLALGDARRGSFFSIALCKGALSGPPDISEFEAFVQKVAVERELGTTLLTLEDPARLKLSPEIEVQMASPTADLLLEAWAAKSDSERAAILGIPPEPYYLRPPFITQPK